MTKITPDQRAAMLALLSFAEDRIQMTEGRTMPVRPREATATIAWLRGLVDHGELAAWLTEGAAS